MNKQIIITLLATAGCAMAQPPQGDCNNQQQPPSAENFIAAMDTDQDGQVSQAEFKGPAEHFAQLDKNSDGYISSDEAPTGPPPQKGQRGERSESSERSMRGRPQQQQQTSQTNSSAEFITRLDKDGDGKVSQSEFDGPAEHFTQLDKDGDNFISSSEAPAGPPPREGRQQRR